MKSLHAKIGELPLENDCLQGALTKAGLLQRWGRHPSDKLKLVGITLRRIPAADHSEFAFR